MAEKPAEILIVDDEELVRKLLNNQLTMEGYLCYEAGNARQAIEKLRHNSISLVMLDIKMPGKSGVALLPEIKSAYPEISVIMITAAADMKTAVQCMKQGAFDYITKPFEPEEITIDVARALEKRRLELENKEYQQHLEDRVNEQTNKVRAAFISAITSLVYALEAKDAYTSGHSQRVADLSATIAEELRLPPDKVSKLKLAALLHDIGKIGIPESVLNKPGPLSREEFELVKHHPEIGEHILRPIIEIKEILEVVRNHHEHYNGKGYPDGLQKIEIPLGARILAISDAYEAMTSERPYREAMTADAARNEIKHGRGTQFDPEIADIFNQIEESRISNLDRAKYGKK